MDGARVFGRRAFGWAALGLLLFAGPADAGLFDNKTPKVGEKAPDFHATLFNGRKVSLADFRGRVVIVNLWATWCAPCRGELPLLDVYYKLRRDFGLSVVAATVEDDIPDSRIAKLSSQLNIPLAKRLHGAYPELGGVPTNYVIDRSGVIRYAKADAFTLDELNTLLLPLLKEEPPVDEAPDPLQPPPSRPEPLVAAR